ncbi:MAG TPA: TonB-dependent receptor [Longimicrobiaceae bacterium]|nr:TonB-dependent receptor [Longimicrobiaceae bacterium]
MRTPVLPTARPLARLLLAFALLLAGALSGPGSSPLLAQGTGQVAGTVTGAADRPVAGATVEVVGTGRRAVTGADGSYTIPGVAPGSHQVRATALGFGAQTQAVTVVAGQTATANFRLEQQAIGLESLVVVGYTTQDRRTVSDAVTSVSAEQLENQQVATVEEALRGRVAGVNIVSSGEPGRESQVVIRGQNFLSAAAPLYVVDGMYTRQNPNLNPEDIESVQVLKDASAAAQYGAQSANGVIVINTRRGRAGAPRVTVNSYYGFQDVPRRIEFMDGDRWLEIARMARQNAGLSVDNSFRFTSNTDWQDAVFQQGAIQDHNVTVSGGSENASYLIGVGRFDQTGTIINTGFERYSFRVNSEARRGRLRVGQNASISRFERQNVVGFPLIDVARLQPGIPVRDPNNASGYGYGSGSDRDFTATFGTNPVGAFEREDNTDISNRVLGSLYGEFGFTDYLKYRVNLGVDYQDLNWRQFIRQRQIRQNTVPTFNEGLDRRDNTLSLLMEHLLTFDNAFGDHALNAVAGVTEQTNRFERLEAYRRGFADEDITEIDAGTSNFANRGFEIPSALRGYLVRANYSFADRYLLTGTFRRDGSSRFGPGNRWANFASGSVGWVISEEPFFSSIPGLGRGLDYLKLRASYGSLGNQDIGDFQYAAAIVANQSYLFGNTIASGSTQLSLANPNIRWQDQTQTNVGLDFNLLDNRLELTADYYVSESDGLLVSAPIPWSLGAVGAPTVNAGTIRNSGFELGARFRHSLGDLDLNWGANLTTIDNEVVALGNGGQPIFAGFENISRTTVGGSIGEFFVIKTAGIFRSEAEVQAHRNSKGQLIQPNAKPGDVRYVDLNDDGLINQDDRQVVGSPIPDLEGGLNLDATFRSFNFGIALRGSRGAEVFNVARFWTDRLDENSAFRADLDPWSPQNPDGRDPRPVFGTQGAEGNARPNTDRWIEDGSYLRIQNLVLGYVLPGSLTRRLGVAAEGSRIYLNIQNLHTFTGFSNWDPEIRGFDSPLSRGIDDGRIYPNPRTFTLGIDLNL